MFVGGCRKDYQSNGKVLVRLGNMNITHGRVSEGKLNQTMMPKFFSEEILQDHDAPVIYDDRYEIVLSR